MWREEYPKDYNVMRVIPRPSTWRCGVDNLEVNSKFVLIHIEKLAPVDPSEG